MPSSPHPPEARTTTAATPAAQRAVNGASVAPSCCARRMGLGQNEVRRTSAAVDPVGEETECDPSHFHAGLVDGAERDVTEAGEEDCCRIPSPRCRREPRGRRAAERLDRTDGAQVVGGEDRRGNALAASEQATGAGSGVLGEIAGNHFDEVASPAFVIADRYPAGGRRRPPLAPRRCGRCGGDRARRDGRRRAWRLAARRSSRSRLRRPRTADPARRPAHARPRRRWQPLAARG